MAKKIKVILGSVRRARSGDKVAEWVMEQASKRSGDVSYELLDLREINLPLYDEPFPPKAGKPYTLETTKEWSRMIGEADGFVFVTPEYNHGYSPALKNAIDHLYREWVGKPVAMVGYGAAGASDSIRQLREVMSHVDLKPLDRQVGISSIWDAFDAAGVLKSGNISGDLDDLLSELEANVMDLAA
jgi:NAD(P)H-dependent FMN reductase